MPREELYICNASLGIRIHPEAITIMLMDIPITSQCPPAAFIMNDSYLCGKKLYISSANFRYVTQYGQ